MFLSVKSAWEAGKAHEIEWWLGHLRKLFSNETREPRFDQWVHGEKPFEFGSYISHIPSREIKVLDIGAGPITQVGQSYPDKIISITAVDPLADEYSKILHEVKITPAIKTIRGEAETLDTLFEPNTFDFAYCRNALDHSYDPLTGISQIMRVLKPGAIFHLIGHRNEAHQGKYIGLHQWNFEVKDGHALLWRPGVNIDVAEALSKEVELVSATGDEWYMITLRKRGAGI